MYVVGNIGRDVNQYELSIPWDIDTATFTQVLSVSGEEVAPRDVFFKPDGTKM